MRRRGGFSDNPNSTQFRNSIKAVIITGFLNKSKSANCEEDEDFNLIVLSKMDHKDVKQLYTEHEKNWIEEDDDLPKLLEKDIPSFDEIEQNVLSCITGYLARIYLNKFPCADCLQLLVGEKLLNMRTFLLYFKEYKDTEFGLKWPTDEFYAYMAELSELYFKCIEEKFYQTQLRKSMCDILHTIPLSFFKNHHHCEKEKKFIVYSFVTMMIKHKVKRMNLSNYVPKLKKKLKHVMHQ